MNSILQAIERIDQERDELTRAREITKARANGSHIYKEGATPVFVSSVQLGSHPQEVSPGL